MTSSLRATGALAAALALAAPAAASADTTLTAGPLKVRDYQLTLLATDGARDSLSVMLSRRAGASNQLHMYSFATGATVKASGKKPSIVAKLGRFGSVKLTLGGLKGGRGTLPPGCTGNPGRYERGTFAGSLKLTLDSTYFKTVKARSLKGARSTGGSFRCDGGTGAQPRGLMLSAMAESAPGTDSFMVSATRDAGGKVTQTAMRSDAAEKTRPASVMHLISASGPAAAFTTAADLSSAKLTGVSPFLAGTLSFAGEAFSGMASGEASGDFAAKFDSIGTQRLPAGTSVTLMQR